MSKLAKLVQLFAEGTEVVLPTNTGESLVFWVNKLNPFQEEQANQAGRVARSRAMLAVKQIGTPEYALFESVLESLTKEAIIGAIVQSKATDFYMRADKEMRHDEEWRERLEIMENSEGKMRPEEEALLTQIQQEVTARLAERYQELEDDLRDELQALGQETLRDTYREAHMEQLGLNVFSQERQRHVTFMALRECEASPPEPGGAWDHSECDHSIKLLDEASDVDELPDALWQAAREAYQNLVLPQHLARFTGALESSSDSPELSDSEEESAASGQAETSIEPDTTSS